MKVTSALEVLVLGFENPNVMCSLKVLSWQHCESQYVSSVLIKKLLWYGKGFFTAQGT